MVDVRLLKTGNLVKLFQYSEDPVDIERGTDFRHRTGIVTRLVRVTGEWGKEHLLYLFDVDECKLVKIFVADINVLEQA